MSKKFGLEGELCLLFPTQRNAEHGKDFIRSQALEASKSADVGSGPIRRQCGWEYFDQCFLWS